MAPSQSPEHRTETSKPADGLAPVDVDAMLDIAQDAIASALRGEPHAAPSIESLPEALRHPRGAFVTLTVDGELNGCIGTIEGAEPLGQAIHRLALAAAFDDPRLPALRADDYPRLTISISLLSPLSPLQVISRSELLHALRPGHDGLVISAGSRRALFLPSVWEQLPDPEDFLDQLWRKAGLRPRSWPQDMRAYRFVTAHYERSIVDGVVGHPSTRWAADLLRRTVNLHSCGVSVRMPSDDASLRVTGVTQRFGERLVLDDVDLEVPPGRVIGLLGPNGAGKTTLMRIVFGVLPPDAGTVTWSGRPANAADRRSWGYMPQERGLYRDMRVADHLVWLARLHGLERREGERRSADLLARLDLSDRARTPIKELSGGMAQRVQLAAAMVHDPELLVLDEPFAGLDPTAVEFLSHLVLDHVRRGRHLLLSSHQLDLVEDVCESITMLHHGRVALQGEVAELKAASPNRYLRVDVPVDQLWLGRAPARVEHTDASGSRVRLLAGADAAEVLDLVRAHAAVRDFGVESPTLSELFLAATGTASGAHEVTS